MKGTVKWFNTKKGYGFIQPEDGNKDVFVHVTALEKTGLRRLFDGQVVNFETYDDRGRIAAGNITIINYSFSKNPVEISTGFFVKKLDKKYKIT